MKFSQTVKILLLVLLSFTAYYVLFLNFQTIKNGLDKLTHQGLISYILTYFVVGIPVFIGTYFLSNKTNIFESLGLTKSVLTGILTAVLFTLPMFIGSMSFFKVNNEIDMQQFIAGTIVAGFMEELFFRGFLFGQIFKKTRLGFIPSIFFGALLFAFGHLYQSQNTNELIGIFMITFFGAIFFAWLYVEWNYNLWIPIFTHTLMNVSWNLFEVDSSALGDIKANIFRGLTIITAILFTILYKRKKNQKIIINRQTLMLKKKTII